MIERKRLLSLGYYKKAPSFTGSDKNKNYKIEAMKDEDKKITGLKATVWPGPLCLASTDDSKKLYHEAVFSEDGLLELVDWMNEVTLPSS